MMNCQRRSKSPRRQWSWIIAGVLALAVLLLYNLNRSQIHPYRHSSQSDEHPAIGNSLPICASPGGKRSPPVPRERSGRTPAERLNRLSGKSGANEPCDIIEVRLGPPIRGTRAGPPHHERGVAASSQATSRQPPAWPEPQSPTAAAPQPLTPPFILPPRRALPRSPKMHSEL